MSIIIDETRIPLHEETYKPAEALQTNPIDYALLGGEDFQLVFTAPKEPFTSTGKPGFYYIDW